MFYKLRFTAVSELTIGILLTDHVLEDLQVKHGDQNDFYNKIFTEADPNIRLKIYDVTEDVYPEDIDCLLYTSPSPRDLSTSRMPSSA